MSADLRHAPTAIVLQCAAQRLDDELAELAELAQKAGASSVSIDVLS